MALGTYWNPSEVDHRCRSCNHSSQTGAWRCRQVFQMTSMLTTYNRVTPHTIAAFIAVLIVGPVLWMALDREPPYIIANGHMTPDHPYPGQQITIEWDLKSVRACPASSSATVHRTIVDSKGVKHDYATVHAIFHTDRTNMDVPTIIRTLDLPGNISPGLARYYSEACYPCNPIQEFWPVCIQTPDILFEVVPRPR